MLNDFLGLQDHSEWEKILYSKKRASQMDSHMQKTEVGPLLYTIHKDQFKMNQRPKYKR